MIETFSITYLNGDSFSSMPWSIYEKLYAYLNIGEEMPYLIQKARDGDPDEWIQDRLEELIYDDQV